MKTKEEIDSILKGRIMEAGGKDLTCVCCSGPRTMGPASEFCFKCHRRGCTMQPKRMRKCR